MCFYGIYHIVAWYVNSSLPAGKLAFWIVEMYYLGATAYSCELKTFIISKLVTFFNNLTVSSVVSIQCIKNLSLKSFEDCFQEELSALGPVHL